MPPSRSCADGRPVAARLLTRLAAEDGNAALEFLGAGVLLLVPLVYLIVALAAIQAAAFGVEGAARQAARMYATADDDANGRQAVADAVEVTLADYGVTGSHDVAVACSPAPADCLTRGGTITVTIDASVALPLAPAAFGGGPLSVPVRASVTQPVSRFRPAVEP